METLKLIELISINISVLVRYHRSAHSYVYGEGEFCRIALPPLLDESEKEIASGAKIKVEAMTCCSLAMACL